MSNEISIRQNQEVTQNHNPAERKVFLPAVKAWETAEEIVILADMPGADEKSVDITLENSVLTLQGRTQTEDPAGNELLYAEYIPGDYRRSFTLATEQIDTDKITASMKNGVLKVVLPKSETVKPRRIEVKAE
jgi:HSP20 family protein